MRVFLSHSVKGDAAGEAIARDLYASLEKSGFEPFLDLERLRIGEDWEATLRNEIEQADAAVLLLSRKAIKRSEWVAREIHLLQIRESNRPGFLILPLLLGDADSEELGEGRLAHLDLPTRQLLRIADEPHWIDLVLRRLGDARTGVLETYLAALRSLCERLPHASLEATESVPRLSDIYVRQFIEEQAPRGGRQGGEEQGRRSPRPARDRLDVETVLHEHDHLLLEGGPGTGKSTLLSHVATELIQEWESGQQRQYLPVLVTARTFVRRKERLGASLRSELGDSLGRLLMQPLPDDFFDRGPTPQSRWLILVDALDEVLDRRELQGLISDLLDIAGRADVPYRFVLTTRPIGLTPHFAAQGFQVHQLLPFGPAEVRDFAHKWFEAREEDAAAFLERLETSRLRDLVMRPLLLTIAAAVYEKSTAALESRAALYREFVAIVVDREERAKDIREELRERWAKARGQEGIASADKIFNNRRVLLSRLARHVHSGAGEPLAQEAVRFSRERGWIPADEAPEEALPRMEELLGRLGIIVGLGRHQSFLHPTFADYLIAVELDDAQDEKEIRECLGRWNEESQRETVLFLLGIWGDKNIEVDRWLKRIFDSGPEGVRFCGLVMAEGVSFTPGFESKVIESLLAQTRELGLYEIHQRPNAPDVLGLLKGRESVRTGLLELARGEEMSEGVRDRTADALARLGCVEDLRDLSFDPAVSPSVRVRAAAHLGRHDPEPARRELVTLVLDQQTDGYLRIDAVGALWGLGFKDQAHSLALYLSLDPGFCDNEHLRVRMAETLGHIGRPDEALDLLFRAVHDPEVDLVNIDLVPAVYGLGGLSRLLETRLETQWSWPIAEASVRWLYRYGEDEAGARLLAEMLDELPESERQQVHPTWIFQFVQDQPSLARLVEQSSVGESFRAAAAEYLDAIDYREEDQRSDLPPRLELIHTPEAGILRRLQWGTREVLAAALGLASRTRFSLQGAAGRPLRWIAPGKYLNQLGSIARNRRASESQRLKAVERFVEVADDERAADLLRIMAADTDIWDVTRATMALILFEMNPTGDDWRLIADASMQASGLKGARGLEYYFEQLGETEEWKDDADRLIARIFADTEVDIGFQLQTVLSVGSWPDSPITESLARTPSMKPCLRVAAVRQIPESQSDLLSSLTCDESVGPWAQIEAIDRLGRYGRAPELLSVAAANAIEDRVRAYAIWWLGRLGTTELAARLRAIAETDLPKSAATAIEDALVLRGLLELD